MKRERALKIVLVVVGVLFCAALYPLVLMVMQDPALAMMMSLYATLGIFLIHKEMKNQFRAFEGGEPFAKIVASRHISTGGTDLRERQGSP
jgi:formate hydrogenlyase subunit 4